MILIPGLHLTADARGRTVFGVTANGHTITTLTVDESRSHPVEPAYYGLTQGQVDYFALLNKTLDDATQTALDAGCLVIQGALGIETGDVAGTHFSAIEQLEPLRAAFAEYIILEVDLDITPG